MKLQILRLAPSRLPAAPVLPPKTFQINSAADEIFISGATVNDVSIISALGANQLTASGEVVSSTSTATSNTTTSSAVSGSTTAGSGSSTGSSGAGY